MKKLFFTALLLIFFVTPSFGDPVEDAQKVVDDYKMAKQDFVEGTLSTRQFDTMFKELHEEAIYVVRKLQDGNMYKLENSDKKIIILPSLPKQADLEIFQKILHNLNSDPI